ncbi:MAG: 4-diphosphocytidyl-2-C-methyl-D-erythritol kinase [uncultured bacterium]|nr:MAG: 4-diphosphocytidyl-2-C-methyl-D-erythritol kinase [uncultured bacterium]
MATEYAYAKVNLTLHVTGQRSDGYHLLDSLVVFCGIADALHATPAQVTSLVLQGPFAKDIPADCDNLVLKAARLLQPGLTAAFTLTKNLPPASGIGGGTADAAAALRVLLRLARETLPIAAAEALAAGLDRDTLLSLGADMPVCFAAHPARMRGIGERLDWLPPLPEIHIVLVNPRVEVPTPLVFKALASKENPPMPASLPDWPDGAALAAWLTSQRNDLQPAAIAHAPVIGQVLAALAAQPDALIARMSGSGATCFALFSTAAAAETAHAAIASAQPGWWCAAGPVYSGRANMAQGIVAAQS